jgi:hypothetical protein
LHWDLYFCRVFAHVDGFAGVDVGAVFVVVAGIFAHSLYGFGGFFGRWAAGFYFDVL